MSLLAVLVYLFAFGIPVYLLVHFHSQAWYWHGVAIAAALTLGFLPTPESLRSSAFDLGLGSIVIFLLVWGIGGLVTLRPHREKNA